MAFWCQTWVEVLRAIRRHKPGSIYELAKILGRDLKNVNDDLKLLADLGLVKLEKRKTDRRRIIATVDYNRIMLEISV